MSSTDSPKGASTLLGARASNAGDVFHELWALRCALRLLTSRTELKAITVEGVAASTTGGYQYDGVDCGLFYGEPTIERATRVELLQLKYSTAKPDKAWTAARLTASTASKGDNSVLRKLADTFVQAKKAAHSSAEIIVRLVSNQPLAQEVTDAIEVIRNSTPLTPAATRIANATGLQGPELLAFLRALDFTEMGAGSHAALSSSLTSSVSDIINGNADAQVLVLQGRIRQLMMPGAERDRVTQNTVLSWFGLSSLAGLFPAPQDFQPTINPIARHPAKELLDALRAGNQMVCLHGQGGCGKTTTVLQLATMLPPASIAVTFDCYGAGRYTRSNDRRHLPENAFLQIINELAWTQETPLLVANSSTNPATINTFVEKVSRSAHLLSASGTEALLVIIIDAADNSVAAAELTSPPSPCFVWDLAQADLSALPGNVRIVFSTRTARKAKLQLPSGTLSILCPPFTIDETRAFARSRYPAVPEVWVEQFQSLSNGIPRVQAYAFARGGTSAEDALESLRPTGKKLDTVLRELFQAASSKAGNDAEFYGRCVAALAALPAPVPLAHLAGICDSTVDIVSDFVGDVQPTLRVEGDTVTIADEDVEDFLQQEASPRLAQVIEVICQYFSRRFRTDAYAAVHYCDFLARAARWAEILPIVEQDLLPAGIGDPIERREVQLRRLRLALGACRSAKSAVDTVKVVLLSAEAAKDEDSFRELLEQETDLSVRFASSSLVRLVLSDRDRYPKHGSVLAQDAAYAALKGDFVSARERLSAYDHWMRRRQEIPQDKRRSWDVDKDDVVAIVETISITDGAKAGIAALRHWKPVKSWPRVGLNLAPRLIARGNQSLVEDAYNGKRVPAPWSLILTVPLALAGAQISTAELEREILALRRSNVPDVRAVDVSNDDAWELGFLETIVTACEIGLSRGVSETTLKGALKLVLDHRRSPSRGITRLEALKIDITLRAWLMDKHLEQSAPKNAEFTEWIKNSNVPPPPKKRGRKKKKPEASRSERDEEFSQTISAIFPIYTSRLAVLLEAAQGPIAGIPKASLTGLSRDAYYFDRDYWSGEFRRRAAQSVVRLMHIPGISVPHLFEQAQAITASKGEDVFGVRSLAVWQELLLRPSMHQSIVDAISDRMATLRDFRTGSRGKADALVKFCRVLLNFSPDDARVVFEWAIEIVQEIDREAMVQIEFVAAVLDKHGPLLATEGHRLAERLAAFITDVAIRLEGEERFPWQNATRALFTLSPSMALAALSQWQDEGIASLTETLPEFASKIAAAPHSELILACSLLVLMPRPPFELFKVLASAAGKAESGTAARAFEMLAQHCLLHTLPESRVHLGEIILAAIPPGQATGPLVERLRRTVAFSRETKTETPVRPRGERSKIEFATDADFSTVKGINVALEEVKKRKNDGYIAFSSILAAARQHITSPAQRVTYLNAVAAIDGDSLEADDRAEAILDALREWHGPAIENWKVNQLPRLISENLWPLSRWLHDRHFGLPRLLDASGVTERDRIEVIAKGLEDGPDGFSSRALFSLADLMAPGLSRDEQKSIASWYVTRLYEMVPPDIRARYDETDVPTGLHAGVARFMFALMSDIDTRIRWRAAHCLRQVVYHYGEEPVRLLCEVYPRTAENSFRILSAPFYWMAARLWSVISLARIAVETPRAAAAASQTLMSIVLDKGFPHYVIRHYAKTALDALTEARVISPTNVVRRRLDKTLQSSKRPVEVKRRTYRELGHGEREKRRFNFDSMDTVPYWYSPVYRLFATLTPDQFFSTLEKWIIDRWEVDPEANWWDKEPRKARLNDREQMNTMRRHGSQPVVERYGTYLEWHALFCGLGEWIKSEPLAVPEWESDKFEYYLKRWGPTEPPTWLADRRGLAPLETDFIFDEGGNDKHWLRRVPKKKYLAALSPREKPSLLVVEGHWTVARRTRQSVIEVSSALVSPETATSLLQTLRTAERYRFGLPYERPDDPYNISYGTFQLRSWLAHMERETQFDDHDPLRNEVTGLAMRPAFWLIKQFGLKRFGLPSSEWRQSDTAWFTYATWADFDTSEGDSRHRQRDIGTYGYRLHVSRDALKTILATEGLDLIVRVEYERRLEDGYGRSSSWNDKEKRCKTQKYFIFRRNGAIEDEGGRVGNWC